MLEIQNAWCTMQSMPPNVFLNLRKGVPSCAQVWIGCRSFLFSCATLRSLVATLRVNCVDFSDFFGMNTSY